MLNFINKLFKNDWTLIETFSEDYGSYLTKNEKEICDTRKIETSYYYVLYSKSRNKVKMKKENVNHITKKAYQDALNFITAINQDLLEGKNISDILNEI
jgi:hypothetical protein